MKKNITIYSLTIAIITFCLMGCSNSPIIKNYLPENLRELNKDKEIIKKNKIHFCYTYHMSKNDSLFGKEGEYIKYEYDTNGLLIKEQLYNKDKKESYSNSYFYDENERLVKQVDHQSPWITLIRYSYDANNNLKNIIRSNESSPGRGNDHYRYYGNRIESFNTPVSNIINWKSTTILDNNFNEIYDSSTFNNQGHIYTRITKKIFNSNNQIKEKMITGDNNNDVIQYYYKSNVIDKITNHTPSFEYRMTYTIYFHEPNGLLKGSHYYANASGTPELYTTTSNTYEYYK